MVQPWESNGRYSMLEKNSWRNQPNMTHAGRTKLPGESGLHVLDEAKSTFAKLVTSSPTISLAVALSAGIALGWMVKRYE